MTIDRPATPRAAATWVSLRNLTVGLCMTVVAIAFEAIAVATAMPVAARELDGVAYYAWLFSLFVIGMLFSTVVTGRLSDRIGPARPLLVGLVIFAAGLVAGRDGATHSPADRRPADSRRGQRGDQHRDLRLRRPGVLRPAAAADVHLHLDGLGASVVRRSTSRRLAHLGLQLALGRSSPSFRWSCWAGRWCSRPC